MSTPLTPDLYLFYRTQCFERSFTDNPKCDPKNLTPQTSFYYVRR